MKAGIKSNNLIACQTLWGKYFFMTDNSSITCSSEDCVVVAGITFTCELDLIGLMIITNWYFLTGQNLA